MFARTKIQPPRPRAGFVARGAVQRRLADALRHRRLVLLCAPAGYGKTMLLAQEIASLPASHGVAWISADAGDDLQRLLECLLAALEPFDPPWRTAPESLIARAGQASPDAPRAVAAELINTLEACEIAHGTIVVDDAHRIDDPAFFRFADHLVERLGARWNVAMTSRTEPPIALARLRARDDVAELRQVELTFARDEARALASEAGLAAPIADRLFDRTQGWPAGLRIAIGAATAGAGTAQPALPVASLDRALRAGERSLFDFLVTEVVDQLPPGLAAFLTDVSVLPELEASRCAQVAGTPDAASLLAEIERRGLFVETLDAPVPTLRLHDLFRDALLQRLALRDPARLATLRERAAATERDPMRRIALLLDAGALAAAAELALDELPMRMPMTGPQPAVNVLAQFPAEFRDRSPGLAFVRGLTAYFRWEFGPMHASMVEAEQGFDAAGERDRALHARACRAIASMGLGRMDEAGALVKSMQGASMSLGTKIVLRNAEAWLALETGRGHEVAPIVDAMLDLLEEARRPDLWYQTSTPNRFPGLRGMARTLERHAELLMRAAGDDPTPLRGIAMLCQGWAALWAGRLREAQELESRAEADVAWTGHTAAVRGHLLALRAFRLAIAGNATQAIACARLRVGELEGGYREWGRYVLWFFAGRVAAICGDAAVLREALAQIDLARARLGADGRPERTRMIVPLEAQLAALEGRSDDALARWREALAHDDAIDVLGQSSETRVRLAHALLQRGEVDEAVATVEIAVAREPVYGGPGGALFATAALHALSADARVPAALRERLRGWAALVDDARDASPPAETPAQAGIGTAAGALTARETDVLARIAAGDSNKLIARALDLSLHTVKRHVANILGKLDVETRGQAAAWYRSRPR